MTELRLRLGANILPPLPEGVIEVKPRGEKQWTIRFFFGVVRTVLKYGIQRTGFNNQEKCEMSTGFLAAYKKKLLSGKGRGGRT